MSRIVPLAVVDGLARKTGKVDNGPALRSARSVPVVSKNGFSPVVVKQPGIGGWICDSCKTSGTGGTQLLEHAAAWPNHRRYTPDA